MDGVTILNINTYRELPFKRFCGIMFLFALLYILLLVVFREMLNSRDIDKASCAIGVIFVSIMFSFAVGTLWKDVNTVYTDYLVTIDDTVALNEFMERYEIRSQEGKILTVREREIVDE